MPGRTSCRAAAAVVLLAAAALLAGPAAADDSAPVTLYSGQFTATDINGGQLALADLAGKVTLIVNTASKCGYTDVNFKGLQEAYDKYREYGLEVLAFPCNQFGGQEPGGPADITAFATKKYGASFPIMAKVEVNGATQHPIFAWLQAQAPAAPGKMAGAEVGWNFEKWLINKTGHVVKHFGSDLDGHELETAIYNELVKDTDHQEL